MSRRLRDEDGFTLPELLTGIVISSIIMLAAFALLETTIRRTGETQARVEATQRGRQALDVITRQLRSQVCLPSEVLNGVPTAPRPAMATADPYSAVFYADLSNGTGSFSSRVERRVLTYEPAQKRIVEERYRSTGGTPLTFTAVPMSRRVLVSNVVPDPRPESQLPGNAGPAIFRYYAFAPSVAGAAPQLNVELVSPNAANIGRIARIDITYVTRAGSEKGTSIPNASLTLRDQVTMRAADPNDPAPYPTCA